MDTLIHALRRPAKLSVALLACATASCATMTESECLVADWYAEGIEDGARGRSISYAERHHEACADTGVVLDMSQYEEGRQSGLERYCTVSSGLSEGRSGSDYGNVCPSALEPDFMRGYELGREVFAVNVKIVLSNAEIAAWEDTLRSEAAKEATEEEKELLQKSVRTAEEDLVLLQEQLNELEQRAARLIE